MFAPDEPQIAEPGPVQIASGPPHYMGIRESAKYLGVSPASIRAWRRRGDFALALMFGRLPRWLAVDLDRWALARREAAVAGRARVEWRQRPSRERG